MIKLLFFLMPGLCIGANNESNLSKKCLSGKKQTLQTLASEGENKTCRSFLSFTFTLGSTDLWPNMGRKRWGQWEKKSMKNRICLAGSTSDELITVHGALDFTKWSDNVLEASSGNPSINNIPDVPVVSKKPSESSFYCQVAEHCYRLAGNAAYQ